MKIRILWTDAQLRADNVRLTERADSTERAYETLFGRHLRQGGQLGQATALIAKLRAEIGYYDTALIDAARAMDERDQEAADYLRQLNTKTAECEALTGRVEAYERAEAKRRPGQAVYPNGRRELTAKDRQEIADDHAFNRSQDTDEPVAVDL